MNFRNPLPVAVLLVPLGGGLLAVRRGIAPGYGQLALPGGYINWGEVWQAAAAREVLEETGIRVDPAGVREFAVRSTPDGSHVLIFGLAAPIAVIDYAFRPDAETLEVLVLTGPAEMAFPLHAEAARAWFEARTAKAA